MRVFEALYIYTIKKFQIALLIISIIATKNPYQFVCKPEYPKDSMKAKLPKIIIKLPIIFYFHPKSYFPNSHSIMLEYNTDIHAINHKIPPKN